MKKQIKEEYPEDIEDLISKIQIMVKVAYYMGKVEALRELKQK